jgi:hypothetical protein
MRAGQGFYPYVEVNGVPHTGLRKAFRYRDI